MPSTKTSDPDIPHVAQSFLYDGRRIRYWLRELYGMNESRMSREEFIKHRAAFQAYMATRTAVTKDEFRRNVEAGLVADRPETAQALLDRTLQPCTWPVPRKVIRYARKVDGESVRMTVEARTKLQEMYRARQSIIDGLVTGAKERGRARKRKQSFSELRREEIVVVPDSPVRPDSSSVKDDDQPPTLKQWQSPAWSITELLSGKWTKTPEVDWERERREYVEPSSDEEGVESDDAALFATPVRASQLADEILDTSNFDLVCLETILDDTESEDEAKEPTVKRTKKDEKGRAKNSDRGRQTKIEAYVQPQPRRVTYLCEVQAEEDDDPRNDADAYEDMAADVDAILADDWQELESEEAELEAQMRDVRRRKQALLDAKEDMREERTDYDSLAETRAALEALKAACDEVEAAVSVKNMFTYSAKRKQ